MPTLASTRSRPAGLGRRELNKLKTRNAILTAANLLITRDGVAGTSMGEIAELAEVSETTVFNYFKTKDELVAALMEGLSGTGSLPETLRARPARERPLQALRRAIEAQEASTEDLESRRHMHDRARRDPLLWGALLRSNYDFAEQLVECYLERDPSWSREKAVTAAHATVGVLEGVFASLPADATGEDWRGRIVEALALLEKGWR